MAAAVLFFDDTGRLLLVEPAYSKTSWELPGGCAEANESPRAAAVREIQEELGLTVEPGGRRQLPGASGRPDRVPRRWLLTAALQPGTS